MQESTKETLKILVLGSLVTWSQALGMPLLASATLALGLHYSGLAAIMTPAWWVATAPLLYVVWLLLVFAASALEIQLLFYRYEKPRHMLAIENTPEAGRHFRLMVCYLRSYLIRCLPLGSAVSYFPVLGKLYYLAYAPSFHLSKGSFFAGFMYDPDLTEVGEDAVVGGGCTLSSHNMVMKGRGNYSYISAKIRIGKRVTIGGESRIAMGVTLGDDSVIEPFSNVVSMTYVPPGEVWGGNPAVFLRKRVDLPVVAEPAEDPARPSTDAMAPRSEVGDATDAARRIVSKALSLPSGATEEEKQAALAGEWDSLVRMAVAATLADAYDCRLGPSEILKLQSVADVARVITAATTAPIGGSVARAETALPRDPEWLPLLPTAEATRLLMQADATTASGRTTRKVAVAASFTAEPLAPALAAWSAAFGVDVEIEFCGYNQIAMALLAADSPFRADAGGLNVVLLRPEDLPTDPDDARRAAATLLNAVRSFTDGGGSVAVGTLPPPVSPSYTGDRAAVDALRRYWDEELQSIGGVQRFEFAGVIERIGLTAAGDAAMELAARAPYSAAAYRELGIEISRLVRRRARPRAKVIALDCDNTLWGGVLGEDGFDGIEIGADGAGRCFQEFQRVLLDLKRQGVLLALVSRNEEADVLDVLDRHPGMLLRRDDVVGLRVNWQPKSQGLQELAEELNLGLDAFVFIDDDPAQRLHVESFLPAVHVFPTPADPAHYAAALRKLWIFDAERVTDEDRGRTEMLRQETARREQLDASGDMHAYLHGLELQVAVREADDADLPRVAQLTQKTNQFNLSLRRRTLDEIKLLGDDHRIYVVSARDRFGDYGQIGVGILRHDAGPTPGLEIDTFLLSCRALGRGVEEAFLHAVFEVAKRGDARAILAPFIVGPRNQPARDFFAKVGFREAGEGRLAAEGTNGYPLPAHVRLQFEIGADAAGTAS